MFRTLSVIAAAGLISATAASEPKAGVAAGNAAFGFDLYAKLRTEPGNVFYSPFSVSAALGMTAAGARGDTLTEMLKTLHLSEGDATHRGFAQLLGQMQPGKDAKYELSVANALWGQQGFPFQPAFVDLISKNYGGGLKPVDFHDAGAAAAAINRWVEEQTKNRIKDLVTPDMLTGDTRLVLTNAIYFKGLWQNQFDKKMTQDLPFFASADKSSAVPMMFRAGKYRCGEADGVRLIELPYKGDRLSMVALLPQEKHQLAAVEAKLNAASLSNWMKGMREQSADVWLPRFEFRTKYRLEEPLQQMGMRQAFGNSADFSGMTSAERLKIDFVVHKAFVKVDEEGSEAAAATAVGMVKLAAPVQRRFTFRADQPFVFLIRDRQTDSVLFIGRVSNPKS